MGGLLLAIFFNEEDHVPVFLHIGLSIMCKMKGGSVDHVFVQYEIALRFWERLYLEAGLRSEIQVGSLLLSARHIGFGKGKKSKVIWGCSILDVT